MTRPAQFTIDLVAFDCSLGCENALRGLLLELCRKASVKATYSYRAVDAL